MRTACPVGSTLARLACRLQHPELRLQLQRVAAERVERLANRVRLVVPVRSLWRRSSSRGSDVSAGRCAFGFGVGHVAWQAGPRTEPHGKYACSIG